MDQLESQLLLSDRFLINGTPASVNFFGDGKIRWSDGDTDRCLAVEKDVIGFASEGSRIRIRAIVENGGGFLCVGRRGNLLRKDFVFEIASADSHRLWSQKLREYIDSLGEFFFSLENFEFCYIISLRILLFMYLFIIFFRITLQFQSREKKKEQYVDMDVIFRLVCVFR